MSERGTLVTTPEAPERRWGVPSSGCILCGGRNEPKYAFASRTVTYCRRCRLGRLEPPPTPEEIHALYRSKEYFTGEFSVGYDDYIGNHEQYTRTFREKLRALLRLGTVGDLLEIGCGPGYFLEEARAAGVKRVMGIDLNRWAIEVARRHGLEAVAGSIDDLPETERFDAIVMLDLIEHIDDPFAFLEKVRSRLRPAGRVLIMTPNIRSLLSVVSGRRWVSYKIPEHLYYYSSRSIRSLLERSGFEGVRIRPTGQYVTLAFLLSRLDRLVPWVARGARPLVKRLGLERRLLYVTNGSVDVLARRR